MPPLGGSFLTNPLFQVISFGAGTAMGPVLRPLIQDIQNETWKLHPDRRLSVDTVAAMSVEGVLLPNGYTQEAAETGYDDDRLQALIQLSDDPPDLATLFALWRRGLIDPDKFTQGLRHHRIEEDYFRWIRQLHDIRLSASEVANAVQQGHMPNPGVLPNISPAVAPGFLTYPAQAPDDRPPSHVPLTQIDVDPLLEAKAHGVDADRLRILANLVGLPPGPEALLTMWNRDLIDEDSVDAGIREGHMKTKWTQAYKRMRWAVLSGQDYAELQLRDWITKEQMYHGGALTGHTPEQMDLLFKNRGRTATPRQVWLAAARQKVGPRGVVTTQLDHEQAIRRSNIRPEYSDMLWEIRHNYPPLFQLSRLVQAGAIPPATAAEWAEWQLYGPEVITALTTYWESVYPGPGGAIDGETKALTKAEYLTEFEGGFIDEAEFRARLTDLGFVGRAQDLEVELGNARRVISSRNRALLALEKRVTKGSLSGAEAASFMTELEIPEAARAQLLAVWDIERRIAAA